jgi:selenocysteine lyase/cysteine desulfurase
MMKSSRHLYVERLGLLQAGGMVRVGPVHYNTLDELNTFGEVLKKIAK